MKTVRRPPYPKWNPGYFPCSSLTPPSAFLKPSFGGFGLTQARLLAIQHSRDDTDFYGPGYAGKSLVWEVISQEDNGEYYEIKLAYRPSGRFRGEPGVEQFTIGKTGTIELRQILDKPVEKRQVSPFMALAAGVVAVLVIAGVASIIVQLLTSEDATPAPTEDAGAEGTVATPAPPASPVETPEAAVATAVPRSLSEDSFLETKTATQ